jgi:phosphate transport system substrate-binding protein
VKLNGFGKAFGVTVSAAALLALSACGSDQNSGSGSGSGSGGAPADCGGKASLTAEGSTAQKNAIGEFNKAWGQACQGKSLGYNATGSGPGRTQFVNNQVDFAGSDSPLGKDQIDPATKRCNGNPAWNLPLVFGPIAMAYNLPGVDKLVLNADVLAKIYTGGITTWNDKAIADLNPGVTLPDTKITPINRKGSSGTSDNFQKYLGAAAPQSWTKGAGGEFQGIGDAADGSAGVAQAVSSNPGAVGYVEKGFADQAKLTAAQVDSGAGAVALTTDSAKKAIEGAKFANEGNDLVLNLDALYSTKEAGAYPIMLATYEIVCSKGYPADVAAAVKSFLKVAANQGQANLAAAGYVPLPDTFKQRLVQAVDAIQ